MNIERGRLNAMLSRKNLFENKSVNATFHGSFKIESNKQQLCIWYRYIIRVGDYLNFYVKAWFNYRSPNAKFQKNSRIDDFTYLEAQLSGCYSLTWLLKALKFFDSFEFSITRFQIPGPRFDMLSDSWYKEVTRGIVK